MADHKPPGITDQEWSLTPPAVRALLTQSIEQIQQTDIDLQRHPTAPKADAQPAVAHGLPPDDNQQLRNIPEITAADDDGATFFMPDANPADDADGATVNMALDASPPMDDDGVTFFMRDSEPTDDADGATSFMPDSEPLSEDEGATFAASLDKAFPPEDDGATFFMRDPAPTDNDDGATMAMALNANLLPDDDDGSTAVMPDTPTLTDDRDTLGMPDDGATAVVPDTAPAEDDGGTRRMPAPRQPKPGGITETEERVATVTLVDGKPPEDDLWEQKIVLRSRYRLRKILGKGGFGAAYLAEDINLKRSCVVKRMLSPKGISPKELAMHQASFEREAFLLSQLNLPGHNNIPDIYDYFSDKSGSYLVMRYIKGQSLKDLVEKSDVQLPWEQSVRYIIDVCSALNYMHSRGEEPVLHRDIKPDNILLGDDGRVWLVDFGLAQAKPVAGSDDLSTDTQAAGSVGYTPFEQWLGEAVPTTDVYATGVTLHYLVTGVSPLEAYREEDGQLRVNIQKLQELHGQLDPLRTFNRELPKELEEIVANAVAAEPEQRLTALQFQQQLDILVSGGQNAALYTFKNGESAYTIQALVDLCEQNRVEAQGYLYRGAFRRWFTLINRNELAEAANKAVKSGAEKDGLEKFLRLIMPNIRLRRLGRAAFKTARVGGQLILVLLLAMMITAALGTLAGRFVLQRTIANYDWNYYGLELDQPNEFDEGHLARNAQAATQLFVDELQVDANGPDQLVFTTNLAGFLYLTTPLKLRMEGSAPRIIMSEVNDTPLYFIGDFLTAGINSGIDDALERSPVDFTSLEVNDNAVIVNVKKSNRVAWNPPTPMPELLPTLTPTPIPPTPTPSGQALLAVFNDLEQDLIMNIEGQTWRIRANDTKVIEQPSGTYNYTVTYAETGQLAAQGSRTWHVKAYKWRIDVDGDTFD